MAASGKATRKENVIYDEADHGSPGQRIVPPIQCFGRDMQWLASQAEGLAKLEQVRPSLQCFGRGPPPGRHLNTSPVSKQRPPRLFTNRAGIKTKSTSKNSQSHEQGELDKIRFAAEEESL